jgi:hypothetical protein
VSCTGMDLFAYGDDSIYVAQVASGGHVSAKLELLRVLQYELQASKAWRMSAAVVKLSELKSANDLLETAGSY